MPDAPSLPLSRPHGTRRCYKTGCHCTPCRAANAEYMRLYRRALLLGRPRLGSRISAARLHTLIRALQAEYSSAQLDRLICRGHRHLRRLKAEAHCSLRTGLLFAHLYEPGTADRVAALTAQQAQVALETLHGLGAES